MNWLWSARVNIITRVHIVHGRPKDVNAIAEELPWIRTLHR